MEKNHQKKPAVKIKSKYVYAETGIAYIVLSVLSRSGEVRDYEIERVLFTDCKALHRFLVSKNARIPTTYADAKLLIAELVNSENVKAHRVVLNCGWHGKTYTTPHAAYGDRPAIKVSELPEEIDKIPFGMTHGSLDGWQKVIAPLVSYSSVFRLLLGAQCTSILAGGISIEPVVFHLAGPSGLGKTAIIRGSMSFVGRANEEDPKTFAATEAGLEDYYSFYNNSLTVIDEMGTLSSDSRELVKLMHDLSYRFCSRQGRQLSTAHKKMTGRSRRIWNQIAVSSGEKSLKDLAAECGRKVPDGVLRRLIDVPVSSKKGMLDMLPHHQPHTSQEALTYVTKACDGFQEHYGVALKPFVEWINANKHLADDFSKVRRKFMASTKLLSGWHHAVVKKFADCCAGGVMGIRAGVVLCDENDYIKSMQQICYDLIKYSTMPPDHIDKLAQKVLRLANNPKKVMAQNSKGRYPGLNPKKHYGFIWEQKGKRVAMLFRRRVDKFTGSPFATMDVAKLLAAQNRLMLGSNGLMTQPVTLPGQDRQVRCLRVLIDV